jgi:hypothetical protein
MTWYDWFFFGMAAGVIAQTIAVFFASYVFDRAGPAPATDSDQPESLLLARDRFGCDVVQFDSEAAHIAALRKELARVARPAGAQR